MCVCVNVCVCVCECAKHSKHRTLNSTPSLAVTIQTRAFCIIIGCVAQSMIIIMY